MLTLVVLLLSLSTVTVQFPKVCTTKEVLSSRVCCPDFEGSSCGSALGRGECQNVSEPGTPRPSDDKQRWPYYWYDSICVCKKPFGGFNCGCCAPGWSGTTCSDPITYPRRSIDSYTKEEVQLLLSQLQHCKDLLCEDYVILTSIDRTNSSNFVFKPCSYMDYCVFLHYYTAMPMYINGVFSYISNFAHYSCGFFTWHRVYLFFFEHLMQVCLKDPTFRTPYFDWASKSTCTVCTDGYFGSSNPDGSLSEDSIFSKWTCPCSENNNIRQYCVMPDDVTARTRITRTPGRETPQMPTQQEVDEILKIPNYDTPPYSPESNHSFRNCAEGFKNSSDGVTSALACHNKFHVYCGGTLNKVQTSPCDPLFMCHHTQCDRILDQYIVMHNLTPADYPANNVPGHEPHGPIFPFFGYYSHSSYMIPSAEMGTPYV